MLTAACMVKCWFTTWASVNKPLVLLGMDSPTPCSQNFNVLVDIRHIYSIYPIFPLWSISAIRIDFLA